MSRLDDHRTRLLNPPVEFRPELRWWLAEGLHTDETLLAEIRTAHRLGFGGMEFLAMDEAGIDHSRYGWGSEEWVHDTQVVVEETTRLGLSVSFTSGTNWSNANVPTIDPDQPAAAQELDVLTEDVAAGTIRSGRIPQIDLAAPSASQHLPITRAEVRKQSLAGVVAAPVLEERDGTTLLDLERVVDLTGSVIDGALTWSAPDADRWRLFFFWMHGTGQTASPSVSVNYTVNYLDPDGARAVIDYWDATVLTPELRAQIAANPRTQMYMDSLELFTFGAGGMLWGHTVAAEFRARRGYDITPWLPFLTRTINAFAASTVYHNEPAEQHRVTVEKVRNDYVATLTDLYIENMLRPFATFLHEQGITLRSEISYGLPFELSRPATEVDGVETESLEFGSQIDAYRLLSGAANLFGKQYSSETGATTRNHMLDHRFYDQIINTQFAVGCTRTVLHGWASTAGAAETTVWPGHEGMLPMFSERFDTRQPASEFYPLWTTAIARCQYLLRQGRPRVDVGILRTDHFVDNTSGMAFFDDAGERITDEDAYGRLWMRNRENHWWQDLGMQDAGWTYEFFDASLLLHPDVAFAGGLVQPDGPGYQALIIYQEALDPDAARLVLEWAQQGLRVLLVNGARELKLLEKRRYTTHSRAASRTPGLDHRDQELADTIAQLVQLPSVAVIDDPAQTLDALKALGVEGRAAFTQPNQSVLTHLREDGDLLHLFAYHFLYETGEPTRVEIALPGAGPVYRVDPWSGVLQPHAGVRYQDGTTFIVADLEPGEPALFTVDRAGQPRQPGPLQAIVLSELDQWSVSVESWDEGAPELIREDRGLGYETRELRPTTAIAALECGAGPLRSWLDLPEVGPDVSGVGDYTATFSLPEPPASGATYLLDLGSTNGGLGSVQVNGGEPIGFDTSHPSVDITREIRQGTNEVRVRVSSSLNNRLLARGYYDDLPDVAYLFSGENRRHKTSVRAHGLAGPVRVVRVSSE